MNHPFRTLALAFAVSIPLGACGPRYQPRSIPVPDQCEALMAQAAEQGVVSLSEAETRQLEFCQEQMALRAAEEQAAYDRYRAGSSETDWIAGLLYSVLLFIYLVDDKN